jgi:hypothetical protein
MAGGLNRRLRWGAPPPRAEEGGSMAGCQGYTGAWRRHAEEGGSMAASLQEGV